MKKLSLQWRITLMTAILIGIACVVMNLLICSSGVRYMDSIGEAIQGYTAEGEPEFFDPEMEQLDQNLTIVIQGAQMGFCATNLHITVAVTILSGILAYFVSGRALRPMRNFASQVEMVQLELFQSEHPDVLPETAEFLRLLREQTERLTQMAKTLLSMSNLYQVPRNEHINFAPMIEEIFTDLALTAENKEVSLEMDGDGAMTGSDTLIYRLLFNLTENAIKYNRQGETVRVSVKQEDENVLIRVTDSGYGIPEEFQRSIFQPFFRVDRSRSREYGGAGLGLSLVWEIAELHGGCVWIEDSSEKGTTVAVKLPMQ